MEHDPRGHGIHHPGYRGRGCRGFHHHADRPDHLLRHHPPAPGGKASAMARVYVQSAAFYEYGNPTPAEQAHLETVNRARANSLAEDSRLSIDLIEGVAPALSAAIRPCH